MRRGGGCWGVRRQLDGRLVRFAQREQSPRWVASMRPRKPEPARELVVVERGVGTRPAGSPRGSHGAGARRRNRPPCHRERAARSRGSRAHRSRAHRAHRPRAAARFARDRDQSALAGRNLLPAFEQDRDALVAGGRDASSGIDRNGKPAVTARRDACLVFHRDENLIGWRTGMDREGSTEIGGAACAPGGLPRGLRWGIARAEAWRSSSTGTGWPS
jgi:hypothetical protein